MHGIHLEAQVHVTGRQNRLLELSIVNPPLVGDDLIPATETKWEEFFDSSQLRPSMDVEETCVSKSNSPSVQGSTGEELKLYDINERHSSPSPVSNEPPSTVTTLSDNLTETEEEEEKLLDSPSNLDSFDTTRTPQPFSIHHGRPSADELMRPAVLNANGRVLIVCAISLGMRGQISSCVSGLNRELILPSIYRQPAEWGAHSLEVWSEGNGDLFNGCSSGLKGRMLSRHIRFRPAPGVKGHTYWIRSLSWSSSSS